MSSSLEFLEGEALKLAPTERRKLVEQLTASLAPELGPGWADEIARRIAYMEAGPSTFAPAHETLGEMRQYLAQRQATM
jgi:putative addiction module component (TIGR02574 family)